MINQTGESIKSDLVSGGNLDERLEFEAKLKATKARLAELPENAPDIDRAILELERLNALMGLGRKKELWTDAREALDVFITHHHWEDAADACKVLFMSEEKAALDALVHGVWIAVSFPVDPALTLMLIDDLIEEMPPQADGAAVAAATAHYVVGMRANESEFENLNFLSTNLLSKIAQNHSNVGSQGTMDDWIERLELDKPEKFLSRFGQVLNAIVPPDNWWFDRDRLREHFPQ